MGGFVGSGALVSVTIVCVVVAFLPMASTDLGIRPGLVKSIIDSIGELVEPDDALSVIDSIIDGIIDSSQTVIIKTLQYAPCLLSSYRFPRLNE